MATILVTGTAGFIGFHLTRRLLADGHRVVGFDNVNDYYSTSLKRDRLKQIPSSAHYSFVEADLADRGAIDRLFAGEKFDYVVNLAAQAGVRYSIENPHAYIQSNIVGFMNILEACRHHQTKHLVYASSSSVYGATGAAPFSEHRPADHPVSLYAATKRSNELMAHTYSHLYGLPATGFASLRSTVRGVGLIWLSFFSPKRSWPVNRSRYSITAKCSETSPTSMTSWRGSSA